MITKYLLFNKLNEDKNIIDDVFKSISSDISKRITYVTYDNYKIKEGNDNIYYIFLPNDNNKIIKCFINNILYKKIDKKNKLMLNITILSDSYQGNYKKNDEIVYLKNNIFKNIEKLIEKYNKNIPKGKDGTYNYIEINLKGRKDKKNTPYLPINNDKNQPQEQKPISNDKITDTTAGGNVEIKYVQK